MPLYITNHSSRKLNCVDSRVSSRHSSSTACGESLSIEQTVAFDCGPLSICSRTSVSFISRYAMGWIFHFEHRASSLFSRLMLGFSLLRFPLSTGLAFACASPFLVFFRSSSVCIRHSSYCRGRSSSSDSCGSLLMPFLFISFSSLSLYSFSNLLASPETSV
jgi:hypothetical protein